MLGLKAGTVDVVEFDPEWNNLFLREKAILEGLIGAFVVDIQHVGSTAVPNCRAKPIVDIAVGVRSLAEAEGLIPVLVQAGYDFRGDAGVPGRLFFAKGPRERRTHHLHVEPVDGPVWGDHLGFRDLLRGSPGLVEEYSRIKGALAEKFPTDRKSYAAGKEAFIRQGKGTWS